MADNIYDHIIIKYKEIKNFGYALSLLNWDQSTNMPPNGVLSRAEISETLEKFSHGLLISDDFYNLLVKSENFYDLNEIQKEEIKKIKKDVERMKKIPIELSGELIKTTSIAMDLWQKAKLTGDDKEFLPYLKKIFELKKEIASCIGYKDNPYDAMLDEYDSGLKYEFIKPLFDYLKNELTKLLKKIKESKVEINDSFLKKKYNIDLQEKFGIFILKEMGIDFNSFRVDKSIHPFTAKVGNGDVRITIDTIENDLKKGFFSAVHEGGHALYEIGVSQNPIFNRFSQIDSLSLHESQSRFYENMICRNELFWNNYYYELQKIFYDNLKDITLKDFYRSINKVELNPIRIEADETTYNLHIILRTQIENDLLNEKIKIDDINDAWNELTNEISGFYPENKSQGYLQDIHWSDGLIGYFPTYTIGNLISAQFFSYMQKDLGKFIKIDTDTFKNIHEWFKDKLYNLGSRYDSIDVVRIITGEELNSKYFLEYLKNKIYDVYPNLL
jgi:carboxypeptidase Taq